MGLGFLDHMQVVPDHRISGMVTYPLDEILLATLAGVVCGADDWEGVEEIATGGCGLAAWFPAVCRRRSARCFVLDLQALQRGFAAWAASTRGAAREVITGGRQDVARFEDVVGQDGRAASGFGLRHRGRAGAGAARGRRKSNEITAIPELLDMLSLKGAIVTIDAMGTQKEIAQRIVDKGADYVLALKGNQTSLHEDATLFFADPVGDATCAREAETDAGHGRIEERLCRAADASWLLERHTEWKGLRSSAVFQHPSGTPPKWSAIH